MTDAIEVHAETVPEQTQAIALRPRQELQPGLFGTSDPVAVIEKASAVAGALKQVIASQGLISKISNKEYPRCEAWTLLGTMLGVFPVTVWTKKTENGWEARVEARTKDGSVIGAAEAECLKSERNWASRDDFALRSMAQTRATAKCLRMPLGFVMTLAGYEATPAEEMVSDHPKRSDAPGSAASQSPTTPRPAQKGSPQAPKREKSTPQSFPTQKTLDWMILELEKTMDPRFIAEFFVAAGILMPNETAKDLPLRWVASSRAELTKLVEAITVWGEGQDARMPYGAHEEPAPGKAAKSDAPKQEDLPKDPEWWRDVIVPIPHKNQKRDEYLKSPDTIGGLYSQVHGQTADGQDARQRLWGFLNHFEPKGWTKKDGTKMPPSEGDIKFREALDAFADWHQKMHPDEKL